MGWRVWQCGGLGLEGLFNEEGLRWGRLGYGWGVGGGVVREVRECVCARVCMRACGGEWGVEVDEGTGTGRVGG